MRKLLLSAILLIPGTTFGHGGGLDSYGCHNETATGTYHCHQGAHAGMSFPSKAEALAYFASQSNNSAPVVTITGISGIILDSDGESGETVSFQINASDSDGIISGISSQLETLEGDTVGFGFGSSGSGQSTATLFATRSIPDGTYRIRASATDNDGAIGSTSVIVTVESPGESIEYDRDDYLPGGWDDADGDCISTRHEVLIIESLIPVTMSENGCFVDEGLWDDPYTGLSFTDPSDVDIDHFVPLAEAHESGAYAWTNEKKQAFANDMLNKHVLIAVDDGANSSKGSRDPAEWLPPNTAYHCEYVRNWVEVKNIYGLEFDEAETEAIESVLGDELHHATRLSQGGIYLNGDPSSARFAMSFTKNDQCPYYNEATTQDLIDISISITPEQQDLGKEFSIYLIPVIDGQFYTINSLGEIIPIDVDPNQLQVFATSAFEETYEFNLARGYIGAPLIVDMFIAYWPDNGELIYTPSPIRLSIN